MDTPHDNPNRLGPVAACTPELVAQIAARLRAGDSIELTCDSLRLGRSTYYGWVDKAREGIEPYASAVLEFAAALADDARERLDDVETVAREGTGDDATALKAKLWLLEKRHPRHFGHLAKVELSGADGAPLQAALVVVLPPLDPDDGAASEQ